MKLRTASLPLAIRKNGQYSLIIRLKESNDKIESMFGVKLSTEHWSRVDINVREKLRFARFSDSLWEFIASKEVTDLATGETTSVRELGLTQQTFAAWFADSMRIGVDSDGEPIPGVLLSFSHPDYLGETAESQDLSDIFG